MRKVMVFGSFDLLHPGHLHLFRQAKQYGDYLIVSIARDETIEKLKGAKPKYSERERKAHVQELKIVDKAVLGDLEDHYKNIEEFRPDVICLGYDQKFFIENLEQEIEKRGLKIKIMRLMPYRANRYKSSKLK